ncbi:MAG: hypothetical protein RR198_01875 [Oscillospiraceae bacterium]
MWWVATWQPGFRGLTGEKGEPGKDGAIVTFDGAAATTYVAGQVVVYNNVAYLVISVPTGTGTPDTDGASYVSLLSIYKKAFSIV